MRKWIVKKWWFVCNGRCFITYYLFVWPLQSHSILWFCDFPFSMHPILSWILYAAKRGEVNTAVQMPDSEHLHKCSLLLISEVLLEHGMSTRQVTGLLWQICVSLTGCLLLSILRQKKRKEKKICVCVCVSFFHLIYLKFQISAESDIFFLPEIHQIISMALTGVKKAMLESLFKVDIFWYFGFLLPKKSI